MNEQVLTTITSASSSWETRVAPACARMPIMTSLSTRFLGHPRLTKPTLVGAAEEVAAKAGVAVSPGSTTGDTRTFRGMQSIDFNTLVEAVQWRWAAEISLYRCGRRRASS